MSPPIHPDMMPPHPAGFGPMQMHPSGPQKMEMHAAIRCSALSSGETVGGQNARVNASPHTRGSGESHARGPNETSAHARNGRGGSVRRRSHINHPCAAVETIMFHLHSPLDAPHHHVLAKQRLVSIAPQALSARPQYTASIIQYTLKHHMALTASVNNIF